jgi:Tol biopolymer transport system component
MADLRTLLERAADGYEPPPDGYRRTLDRAARTHRRRRIGTALLALLIAAVGLSAAALAFRGAKPSGPASRTPPPTRLMDGELAFRCINAICLMRPDGSGKHDLLSGLGTPSPQWDPAWSPDGSKVAFRGYYGPGDGQYALYAVGANGCGLVKLTHGPPASNPTWSPDGRRLAFDSSGVGSIYEVDASGQGLTRLTRGESSGYADGDPAWSSGGVIAFVRYAASHAFGNQFGQLYTMDPAGRHVVALTRGVAGYGEPAWSPDGTSIAAVRYGAKSAEVVALASDGSEIRQVSPAGWKAFSPSWSVDGTRLVFLVQRHGTTAMYTVNADGSHLRSLAAGAGADQVAWGSRPKNPRC